MILKSLFINALIRLIFKNKQKNKALSKSALSDFSNALNKCNSFILVYTYISILFHFYNYIIGLYIEILFLFSKIKKHYINYIVPLKNYLVI